MLPSIRTVSTFDLGRYSNLEIERLLPCTWTAWRAFDCSNSKLILTISSLKSKFLMVCYGRRLCKAGKAKQRKRRCWWEERRETVGGKSDGWGWGMHLNGNRRKEKKGEKSARVRRSSFRICQPFRSGSGTMCFGYGDGLWLSDGVAAPRSYILSPHHALRSSFRHELNYYSHLHNSCYFSMELANIPTGVS